jgi:glycosyltransferase involved in cell wall biosynthesis
MNILEQNNSELFNEPVYQPFFSVVLTTYNRANLLARAINSMVAQKEHDWELIIVDDESTDNTYGTVFPYLQSKMSIRYFRKKHSGEAATKNTGIRLSSGKFISFLDSDDEYDPEHLSSRKAILVQNPSVKFLHGGVKIIGNKYVPDKFDYNKYINLDECVIGGTFFIERSTVIRLDGFRDILLGTDSDLFDRAGKAGVRTMEVKIPTYIYHHENEDSITNILIRNNKKFEHDLSDTHRK